MKKRIHVNQQVLSRNRKTGSDEPAITTKTYKDNRYGKTARILLEGKTVCVVRQQDSSVWIEANLWAAFFHGKSIGAHGWCFIHVDGPTIRANKAKMDRAVLKIRDPSMDQWIAHEAHGPGFEIIYRPNKPLSCGARLWVETKHVVEVSDG